MQGLNGQLDLALSDITRAIHLDPTDDIDVFNRGKIYAMKHDVNHALQDYSSAIKIRPDNYVVWNGRCWLRASMGKELHVALSDCNEAIRLRPGDANILNSRGFVYFRMKQYQEAIRDYDSAIAIDSKQGSSFYVRGLAKQALGDIGGARADIAKGKSLEPAIDKRFSIYGVVPAGTKK